MANILIVDSSECLYTELPRRLQGHNINICRTAAEAITILPFVQMDLLIINLCVAHGNALSLLNYLSQRPQIIALSPIFNKEIFNIAASHGVKLLVPIPCSIDYLIKEVNRMLNEAALCQE